MHQSYCTSKTRLISVFQIICDADQRIIGIDTGHGGAQGDNTVFETSIIGRRIIQENLLQDYYILADNG